MASRSATVSFNPPGNGSLYFGGSEDYLSIPASSDFDLTTNNTLEAWVYCTTGVAQGVMSYSTTTTPVSGIQVSYIWFITAAGKLRFDVNGTGGATETTETTATIPSNVWTHIAVVKTGTSVTQYLNGISSSTATFSGAGNTTSAAWSFRVGTYYTSAFSFNGYIDEARVTKGVARYTTDFTVPSVPFSDNITVDPHYNNVSLLLHGDGVNTSTNFIDSSPTPKIISVFGNVQVSTTQSKFTSSADISGYIVTSVPDGITATGASSPITVKGLDNGTEYTFNVKATSGGVTGPISAQSNKVIPVDIDPYYFNVSLLLHCDGNTADSSINPKPTSASGGAASTTVQSKFGGSSLFFDGVNDNLLINSSTDFSFGTSDFTIECWYNPGGAKQYLTILRRDLFSTSAGAWGVGFGDNGTNRWISWLDHLQSGVDITATAPSSTNWSHFAVCRSSGVLRMFIDGVSYYSGASTNNYTSALNINIGNWDLNNTNYSSGYLDELRITKGVARYTANFAVSKAPFASSRPSYDPYYSKVSLLLHGDGLNGASSIYDSSPTSKPITVFGNVHTSTVQAKFGGSSLYFNGVDDYLTTPPSPSFEFNSADFTVECFFYMVGDSPPRTADGVRAATLFGNFNIPGTDGWGIAITGNTTVTGTGFAMYHSNGTYAESNCSLLVSKDVWHHLAIVRVGSQVKIYFNGSDTSANDSIGGRTILASLGDLVVGRNASPTYQNYFNGYIDDLRITNGVARYTSDFTVPTNQLPAYLPPPDPYYSNVALLLHGEGVNGTSQFTDNSSLPGTLTASGGIVHTTADRKFGSSSIEIINNTSMIEVVKNSAVDLSGTYTIEFWARTSAVVVGDANAVLTTNNNVFPDRFMIDFAAPTSSTIYGRIGTPTNTILYITPTQPYVLGSWAHFAFVNNSTANTHTVFINGVLAGSRAAVPLFNTTTFQVGKCATAWTEGPYQIDDLKITNGVAKYSATFLPPTLEDTYFDPSFSSVSLLLHGTSTNESTTVIDSGSNTKPVTTNGNAQISTTQSKFGGSSIKLTSVGDYLSIPTHTEFDMGATTSFTIECWFYLNSNAGSAVYPSLIMRGSDNTTYLGLQWALNFLPQDTGLAFNISDGSGWMNPGPNYTGTITIGAWHHVALVRVDSTPAGLKLFYDGNLVASSTSNPSLETNNTSKPIIVGGYTTAGIDGYIDDLRITKGVARYTANFILPTTPFPDQ